MVVPHKIQKRLILNSLNYVKSEWEIVKWIFAHFGVVMAHSLQKGLFISNNVVVFQMIVHFS